METRIVYRMEIVGGPFDGASGMRWMDDGENPPPALILMGVCPGDGSCGCGEERACAKRGGKHPYFWLADEKLRPARTTPYELSDSFTLERRDGSAEYPGRAIYVIGGLTLPRAVGDREQVPVGAGHMNELQDG